MGERGIGEGIFAVGNAGGDGCRSGVDGCSLVEATNACKREMRRRRWPS